MVTLRSSAAFWLCAVGAGMYLYALVSHSLRFDWTIAIYAALSLLQLFALWVLALVVEIDAERIVIRRAFGVVAPRFVPLSQITELRSKADSNGRMTRFEVWTKRGRAAQLHIFQANFLAGVSEIQTARSDLSVRVLSSWSIW